MRFITDNASITCTPMEYIICDTLYCILCFSHNVFTRSHKMKDLSISLCCEGTPISSAISSINVFIDLFGKILYL